MTTNQQLEAIRKEIPDKTVSFGCIVLVKLRNEDVHKSFGYTGKFRREKEVVVSNVHSCRGDGFQTRIGLHNKREEVLYKNKTKYKVIGRPPHIGRVMWWINQKSYDGETMTQKINKRQKDRLLLEKKRPTNKLDQPLPIPGEDTTGWEEVIQFLYNLIKP